MRSELVNRLPITQESKIILRSMFEHARTYLFYYPELKKYEIEIDVVFANSSLPFHKGVCAINELHDLNVIDFDYKTGKCVLLFYKTLKFIKSEIESNLEDTDFTEVNDLLSQMELSIQA